MGGTYLNFILLSLGRGGQHSTVMTFGHSQQQPPATCNLLNVLVLFIINCCGGGGLQHTVYSLSVTSLRLGNAVLPYNNPYFFMSALK